MVEISKLMLKQSGVGKLPCHVLLHPWTRSCSIASWILFTDTLKGGFKLWTPIYIILLIQKFASQKKLQKSELKENFKQYLRSCAFSTVVFNGLLIFNCLPRRYLFSESTYYKSTIPPVFLSMFPALFCEPPHRRIFLINLFTNMVFEYWFRTLDMKGQISRTVTKETLIFMIGSATLFYLMRTEKESQYRTPIFWFFAPPHVSKEVDEPKSGIEGRSAACPHQETCVNYVLKGSLQLFGVGCAMTALSTVVPRLLTPKKAFQSLKLSKMKLGLFIGGYIGIYRLVACLLCRNRGSDNAIHALPAGFLAGAAYSLSPSTAIAFAPLTLAMQIICSRAFQSGILPSNLPIRELYGGLIFSILGHAAVMHADTCPQYVLKLVTTISNGRVDRIRDSIVDELYKALQDGK